MSPWCPALRSISPRCFSRVIPGRSHRHIQEKARSIAGQMTAATLLSPRMMAFRGTIRHLRMILSCRAPVTIGLRVTGRLRVSHTSPPLSIRVGHQCTIRSKVVNSSGGAYYLGPRNGAKRCRGFAGGLSRRGRVGTGRPADGARVACTCASARIWLRLTGSYASRACSSSWSALALVFHEAWLLSGAPKRKNAPELG